MLKTYLLNKLYRLFPFPLRGDAETLVEETLAVSCVVPTFQRDKDLKVLLNCLKAQGMAKQDFEVIVVEDGAESSTQQLISKFTSHLNLVHLTNPVPKRNVAKLRNQGLKYARGRFVLYLDDDTMIPQENFLERLVELFEKNPFAGVVQIPGLASFALWPIKYDYLDRYSFATRCVAYKRGVLADIGGFLEELTSYEDIELSIRFVLNGGEFIRATDLFYRHPPLYFESWSKPLCNGTSFLRLWSRYSKPVWALCYLNAMRFLPYMVLPSLKCRQWGKISAGFLFAPFYLLAKRTISSQVDSVYR